MKQTKHIVIAILALFFVFQLQAQDKLLTLSDCIWQNPEIYPQRLSNPTWIPGTDNYTINEGNSLIQFSAKSEKSDTLLTLNSFNALLTESNLDSTKRVPSIKWIDSNTFSYIAKNSVYVCNLSDRKIEKKNSWSDEAENTDLNPKTYTMAYTKGANLFISVNGVEKAITNDTKEGILNGSERVARNEFGITKGTFWSKNGRHLAFYHMDESMVSKFPLVDITQRVATVDYTRYPMAGMDSHQVTLMVYDLETGKTVTIDTEKNSEQYLTMVSWDPNERYIYIGILNRGQNHLALNKYDAATGAFITTLYEERDEQYVEPETPLYFNDLYPDQFIIKSYRDGYDHFYLYTTSGKMVKQLTFGEWDDTSILGFDKKGKKLFYTSCAKSPVESHIYSLDMKSLKTQRLTLQHGTHNALLSSTGNYFIDIYSSTEVCREYQLINANGEMVRTLLADKDPLANYNSADYELFNLEAKDGSELYCRILKPIDFDPSKKYPVFFYVYGGPHSQLVSDTWLAGAGLFDMYMAQQGYIVFTMDNHGTNNRGADFEQAIHRNLGVLEVEDQMIGVNYLKSLPFVDGDRMGVDGWSYGGFMTLSLMLKHPGTFKAACAGGPVIDWKYYEVMYGERYMDTPEENPEGYKNACVSNYIDQLDGHILVIQGTVDPVVVWQNSLSFVQKSVEEGIQIDYFVYPGHEHNVRGVDRKHLYQKISDYFDLYVK